MAEVAAAAVGATVSGVFSSKASKKAGDAAERAAELQAQAQRESINLQREMFETTRGDLAPYRAVGVPALNRLASSFGVVPAAPGQAGVRTTQPVGPTITAAPGSLEAELQGLGYGSARGPSGSKLTAADLAANFQPQSLATFSGLDEAGKKAWLAQSGFSPVADESLSTPQFVDASTQGGLDPLDASMEQMNRLAAGFQTSPGYQFRVKEGENALARLQGARGKLFSGDAIKEAQQFGQGLASDEYNTYMNRATSAFGDYNNRLAALAGVGQSATQAGATAGQNFANSASGILNTGANNSANALLARGAIQAGNIAGIGRGFNNAIQNYQFANALKPPQPANPWINPDLVRNPGVTGTASSLNFWPG